MGRTVIVFVALLALMAAVLWTWARSPPRAWGDPTRSTPPFTGRSLTDAVDRAEAEG